MCVRNPDARLTSIVSSASAGGWGYYTDQASRFVQIENNIATGTKCGGFHQVGRRPQRT
jgi:hypothetical protein